jgi:hypothetical protein
VVSREERFLHERMRISFEKPEAAIEGLKRNLAKLARARQIKRLASRSGPAPVMVSVSVFSPSPTCEQDCLYQPGDEHEERPYAKHGTYGLGSLSSGSLQDEDAMFFAVQNQGRQGYYVYLLNITPAADVRAIFPAPTNRAEHAYVARNERRDLRHETGLLLDTVGRETVKVIATREPVDVRLFEQEGFEEIRGELNPLERLLAAAMHTRAGVFRIREQDWGTQQVEFEVGAR